MSRGDALYQSYKNYPPVEAEASLHRRQIPPRAMTDFSQSHDRFFTDPLEEKGCSVSL
jgi:hypothetical protein